MARNKMTDVRDLLIESMERLRDGDMEPNQAKQMASLGKVLIDSAKVEIDFIDKTGSLGGSGFINLSDDQKKLD